MHVIQKRQSLFLLLFLCHIGSGLIAFADVRLPSIVSDHMVLQRDVPVPIWGWAEADEKVSVVIAGQSIDTTADKEGRWRVDLPAMKAGGPHVLTAKGGNTVTVRNVLIGEVWICSGQSNMVFPLIAATDGAKEVQTAKNPLIRLFQTPNVMADSPHDDIDAKWAVCNSPSVVKFSAVGYFFGKRLHEALNVPIGLIDSSWGGTPAEGWTPPEAFETNSAIRPIREHWERLVNNYDETKANEKYEERLETWKQNVVKASPQDKRKFREPRPPVHPSKSTRHPGVLFNGKIAPIVPYGIRGVIWYQGEANAPLAHQYRTLFPAMIRGWRDEWQQGDFPFYFVQLANFGPPVSTPGRSTWAELREAQLLTLQSTPNTGMAVTIDIGEARDIHPKNKRDVGLRLARWALAKDYGFSVPFSGPIYRSMTKMDGKLILTFDEVQDGLMTRDNQPLTGFDIAGEDRRSFFATAKITDKSTIEVFHPDIADPVAIRYGWAHNPRVNLYNSAKLPATPFRTDAWSGTTQVKSQRPLGQAATSDAPNSKATTQKKPSATELRDRALKHREWLKKLLADYYKQYPEADLNGDGRLTSPERSIHVANLYREETLRELGDKIRFEGDVEYAKAGRVSLKLDLYLPANIDPTNKPPLVTWFHGGGWRAGSKDLCLMAWLATEGFAVASVEYRSTLRAPFPANIHDCKGAIRWLRANAETYGYDARRIGTSGASAGGHLAAILGTSAEVEALEGKVGGNLGQSSRVQAIVAMAGVMSIPDWANTPRSLSTILGVAFSERNGVAELGALCSPDRHLTQDDPPILIMHGDNDQVVPLKQSQDFYKKYQQAGLESTLDVIPRGGHGGPFTDAKRKTMMKEFYDKHLRQL